MIEILGPDGQPIRKAGIDTALTTGSLPAGAVAQSDLSGLADALGGGLSVTSSLGPGVPVGPAHPEERIPRWYEYIPGVNVTITPRQGEQFSFKTLYDLANTWDVAGLAIEKRKDEFQKLEPVIRPRPVPGQTQKQAQYRSEALRGQIDEAMGFLQTPDQQSQYPSWIGRGLDDLFKGDAMCWYLRANRGGGLAAVEVVDGTTIKPVMDLWGRIAQVPPGTPRHQHVWSNNGAVWVEDTSGPGRWLPVTGQPEFSRWGPGSAGAGVGMACQVCGAAPAYTQVIFGMNWNWYGSDEIVYQPRWLRGKGPYGHPPAEWIILSINRALRRQSLDLSWYTEGSIPALFMKIPEAWNIEQGRAFLEVVNALLAGNDAQRNQIIPIPGGSNAGVERVTPEPKNDVEEYLLHIGLAAYAVSPMEMGFIRSSGGAGLGGKGVAQEQTDAGRQRQISLAAHIASIYNRVLATYWTPEIGLFFPSLERRSDQLTEAEMYKIYWQMGAVSTDYLAANVLQLEPPGVGNTIVTQSGAVVPVAAIGTTSDSAAPSAAPSAQPGVTTEPVTKALGAGHVDYTGDLAKVVHRYLLRSYPPADVAWVLDPAIRWEYEPSVNLSDVNYARRPGGRNETKVSAIHAAITAGASMDPAVLADFGEPKLRIADGFHRILAAEKAGESAVPAFVAHDVPEGYRAQVMGPMQDDSTSVKKAAEDLRLWRQKAIRALKRGESAAVPFTSDAIPAPAAELIAKGLAGAQTVADVWGLFGGQG